MFVIFRWCKCGATAGHDSVISWPFFLDAGVLAQNKMLINIKYSSFAPLK
jgi:hypothetical protein